MVSVGLRMVVRGTLGIHTVNIGVVQQALGLQHVDVSHARQLGELLDAFLDAVGLELLDLVGGHIAAQLADEGRSAETRDTRTACSYSCLCSW